MKFGKLCLLTLIVSTVFAIIMFLISLTLPHRAEQHEYRAPIMMSVQQVVDTFNGK